MNILGRYEITSLGVVRTLVPLTDVDDHSFDVTATDRVGHFAIVRVHIVIVGNTRGPEFVFPAFNGDKLVVCEVSYC